MKKKNYKVKWKNMMAILLVVVAFVFAAIIGIKMLIDYNKTSEQIKKIRANVEIKNIVDDEFTKTIRPISTLSKFDIYWNYIKLGLMEVDMANLKRINTETIGYIEVKGTDFSYPIVQSEDEFFYKSHSFDREKSDFGWIYTNPEVDIEELCTNTIIEGNKNYFNQLFGNLNTVFKNDWFEHEDNHLIRMYTNYHSTLWQIISVYKTNEKKHFQNTFESDSEIQTFIDDTLKSTQLRFKGYAQTSDKFLTLTTNSANNNIVIVAKLIKIKDER